MADQAPSLGFARLFIPFLILACVGLGVTLTYPTVRAVWQTGSIHDPDDAMRLVEVRSLLTGQGWFDLRVARLDPPSGIIMHWSRFVDLPLALLIKGFRLVVPAIEAERLMRLVVPLGLQIALYAGTAQLARRLIGRDAVPLAICMVFLSGMMFGQFQPGRIGHHAPEIVLLVFILAALVDALATHRIRPAMIAGALTALSLAISLENMPFLLMASGTVALLWVWYGQSLRFLLLGFSSGLLLALPVCFFATVAPEHWLQSVPDAFSFGQFIGGMIGALLCIGLTAVPARFDTRLGRAVFGALAALITLAIIFLLGRDALHEPFYGLDPFVRAQWLAHVREVWSFARLARQMPENALIFMAPILMGAAAAIAALTHETGERRKQWLMVVAIIFAGISTSLWVVRILPSVTPIAGLGGVWLATRVSRRLTQKVSVAALLFLLPFTSIPWALAVGDSEAETGRSTCLTPASLAPFTKLPPGLVLAPIDYGSHLLAFTPHSVLAAPYHRNNHGNKLALEALMASPETAEAIMRASGATYVAVCAMRPDPRQSRQSNLENALIDGHVPGWLSQVATPDTPYKIFAVAP